MDIITAKIRKFSQRKEPIRSKICIYNKITEQVNCFLYLVIIAHPKMQKYQREISQLQQSMEKINQVFLT